MVRYYLLRDNQETGPYTLSELKGKTLYEADLIWIEDESNCWKLPNEIPELEGISLVARKVPERSPKKRKKSTLSEPVTGQGSASLSPSAGIGSQEFLPPDDYQAPSFEALKEKYAQKAPQKRTWTRQVNIGANLLGMVTLLIGLGLSAYMIKKAVENIEFEPAIASAEAVEIKPENVHNSSTVHAAYASIVPGVADKVLVPDTTTAVTALSQTVTPDVATTQAQAETPKIPVQQTNKPTVTVEPNVVATSQGKKEIPEVAGEEEPAGTPEKVAVAAEEKKDSPGEKEVKPAGKPSLRLAANNYNVGFLGGISNLEISVSNPSTQEINKAVVEVEYLRPNGKVVSSQTVTVSGLAPGSSKTVSIPDNSRGVSVRYKVIKTESYH